mmetsp:Transcript_8519/g.26739  ORF Transcript_8519/g.26739 Transcript_8519/m.26739 type:complete len:174 (+) Transcript_8519:39-560(+)
MAWRSNLSKVADAIVFTFTPEKGQGMSSFLKRNYAMFKTLNPSMPLLVRDYPAEYLQRERERYDSVMAAAPEGYDAAHVPPISDAFVVFDLASPSLRFGLEEGAEAATAGSGESDAVELPDTKRPQVGFALRRLMVDVEGLGADEIDEVFRKVVEKAQTYPARDERDLPPAAV